MPTINITPKVGQAIRQLKAGERINRVKRRHCDPTYYWVRQREATRMETLLFDYLKSCKLLEECNVHEASMFVRRATKAWKASQLCLDMKLPPENFWIEEPS